MLQILVTNWLREEDDSIRGIVANGRTYRPIITPHDTFSVTHPINRVTNDQVIRMYYSWLCYISVEKYTLIEILVMSVQD